MTLERPSFPSFVMKTGNVLVDQFKPWFFGIAFAFCFKYCTAMPDVGRTDDPDRSGRYRRDDCAPRVEIRPWCQAVARRVEAQCGRDWLLGFSMWSYIFRTTVNMCKSFHVSRQHLGELTSQDIEDGAVQITQLLRSGQYQDPAGRWQKVAGDVTKVRNCKI